MLLFAFFVVRGCQEEEIRISQEQAVEIAREQVDFEPRRTQIRFLRQGLNGKPNWVVSLSIPGANDNEFRRLAVVRIDANTGEVNGITGAQRD